MNKCQFRCLAIYYENIAAAIKKLESAKLNLEEVRQLDTNIDKQLNKLDNQIDTLKQYQENNKLFCKDILAKYNTKKYN